MITTAQNLGKQRKTIIMLGRDGSAGGVPVDQQPAVQMQDGAVQMQDGAVKMLLMRFRDVLVCPDRPAGCAGLDLHCRASGLRITFLFPNLEEIFKLNSA